MALSAYEIRVIVSAQDHFSGAFRQIGRDLGKMSRMQAQAAKDTARLNKEINKSQLAQKGLLRQVDSMRRGGKLHTALMDKQARTTEKLARQEDRLRKATAARDAITKKSLPAARLAVERAQANVRAADRALEAASRPTKGQIQAVRNAEKEQARAKRALRDHIQMRKQETIARRVAAREALMARRAELSALKQLEERDPEAERAKRAQVRQAVHKFRSARAGSLSIREGTAAARERVLSAGDRMNRALADAFGSKDTTRQREAAQLARAARTQAHANVRQLEASRTAQNMDLKALREKITATKALQAAQKAQATSMFRDSKELKAAARAAGLSEKQLTDELVKQQVHMQKLNNLERNRARIQAAGHTGRLMTLAGGVGLAAGAGLANYAADFERQIMLAATQTPGTVGKKGVQVAVQNADKLSQAVLGLSKDYGIATEEITKSSYDIFSSIRFSGGVASQYAQGIDVIRMSAMAAVGGLTDMDTAAKASIILANQFGSSAEQLAMNLDTAFAIVKYGNMTFEQFTSMMTKVGSAASRAGYSLQDVAGVMTFLTKKSGKPDEAATWIDRMLQALQTPEFVKGMRLLHAPIDKDGKLKPLSEVMDQILRLGAANKGRGGIGMQNIIPYITSVGKHGFEGGAGLRSTIQAQRGLTFNLQDVKGLKQAQKDVLADHGEFMRSFLAIYNSAGYKWQRLMAGFKVAMLELGIAFLPVMTKIVGYLLYFIQIISNASPHTKKLAAYIFAIGSALVFVSGIIVSVTAGFASIYFWIKILNISSAVTAGASGGWGMLLASMGKFVKVGALVTGVIAGIQGSVETLNQMKEEKTSGNVFQRVMHRIILQNKNMMKHIPGLGKVWNKEMDLLLGQGWLVGSTSKKGGSAKKQAKSVQDYIDRVNRLVEQAMSGKGKQQNKDWIKQAQDALNAVLNQTTTPSQTAADAKRRAQDIVAAQQNILEQASQGLMNMYNEKKQQNESMFGALFAGPVAQSGAVQWRKAFGIQMNVPELLSDFKMQLAQFQKGRNQIASLKKRGLSGDIIADLQARGAEGLPYINALMEATPKQIRQFNSMMGSKKKDITAATEIDFDTQLAKWMKFGASAALKIAAGMESEEFAVQKRLNALATRLWSGIAKTLATQQINIQYGIVPAVKGAPGLNNTPTAKNTAQGTTAAEYIQTAIANGWYTTNPNLYRSNNRDYTTGPGMPGDPRLGPPAPARTTSSVHYHDHYEVNGTFMSEEQMMDRALKTSAFKKKQGRRG